MEKDIVKAIEKEKEYIEYRKQGKEPFHLVDVIRECKFESLDEYFKEKKKYEFNSIEFAFVDQPMPEGVSEIFKMIQSNQAGVLFVDWEDTYVVCANRGMEEFNQQYCEENNIKYFPLHTAGGTIVGSKGDFSFGICTPKSIGDSAFVLNHVASILQKYTAKKVTVNGNDICTDGNKICGSATYSNADVFMIIMHFSFHDLSELIKNICTTTKINKPVSYVDFMTREEFKQEVSKWLRLQELSI